MDGPEAVRARRLRWARQSARMLRPYGASLLRGATSSKERAATRQAKRKGETATPRARLRYPYPRPHARRCASEAFRVLSGDDHGRVEPGGQADRRSRCLWRSRRFRPSTTEGVVTPTISVRILQPGLLRRDRSLEGGSKRLGELERVGLREMPGVPVNDRLTDDHGTLRLEAEPTACLHKAETADS